MQKKNPDNIDYFVMSLALCGIVVNRIAAELILENWDEIKRKGGDFTISDSVEIEFRVMKRNKKVRADIKK